MIPALLIAAAVLFFGCAQPVAEDLQPDVQLSPYTSETLGFRFEYPARYTTFVQGNSIVFQDAGVTAIRVTLASREEATNRGLWGRNAPVASTSFGGSDGQVYHYEHWDGPSHVPTVAFVVPHRRLELGVEFRTQAPELTALHRRILETVRLD